VNKDLYITATVAGHFSTPHISSTVAGVFDVWLMDDDIAVRRRSLAAGNRRNKPGETTAAATGLAARPVLNEPAAGRVVSFNLKAPCGGDFKKPRDAEGWVAMAT